MKVKITMQFKIQDTIELNVPESFVDGIETVTAEEWEEIAYKSRNEITDKLYNLSDETLVVNVSAGDFNKDFNKEE